MFRLDLTCGLNDSVTGELVRRCILTSSVLEPVYIYRGFSTRKPASIVCEDEQEDLFHSAAKQGKLR